jgi:hypothetical protein
MIIFCKTHFVKLKLCNPFYELKILVFKSKIYIPQTVRSPSRRSHAKNGKPFFLPFLNRSLLSVETSTTKMGLLVAVRLKWLDARLLLRLLRSAIFRFA